MKLLKAGKIGIELTREEFDAVRKVQDVISNLLDILYIEQEREENEVTVVVSNSDNCSGSYFVEKLETADQILDDICLLQAFEIFKSDNGREDAKEKEEE